MSQKRAEKLLRRQPQKFDFGNRCGHNKHRFRYYRRNPEYKDAKPVIQKLVDWVKDLATKRKAWARVFGRDEQRSEARERNAAYLGTAIDHMDIVSRRVGVPQKNGSMTWHSVGCLMEGTGIEEEGRFHRAASEVHEDGLITTKRRFKESEIKGKEKEWQYSSRVVRIDLLKRSPYFKEYCDEAILEGQRRQNGGETNEERSARLAAEVHEGRPPRKGLPAACDKYLSPEYLKNRRSRAPP
jgi:hypothetical protein